MTTYTDEPQLPRALEDALFKAGQKIVHEAIAEGWYGDIFDDLQRGDVEMIAEVAAEHGHEMSYGYGRRSPDWRAVFCGVENALSHYREAREAYDLETVDVVGDLAIVRAEDGVFAVDAEALKMLVPCDVSGETEADLYAAWCRRAGARDASLAVGLKPGDKVVVVGDDDFGSKGVVERVAADGTISVLFEGGKAQGYYARSELERQ